MVGSGWETNWRSAAVHYGEAAVNYSQGINGGWHVYGVHHIWIQGELKDRLLGTTDAKDCDIYNDWWDRNK